MAKTVAGILSDLGASGLADLSTSKRVPRVIEAEGNLEGLRARYRAEGGFVVFVRDGELYPVQLETPPKLKGGERRRVSGKRKPFAGPVTKSKASKP